MCSPNVISSFRWWPKAPITNGYGLRLLVGLGVELSLLRSSCCCWVKAPLQRRKGAVMQRPSGRLSGGVKAQFRRLLEGLFTCLGGTMQAPLQAPSLGAVRRHLRAPLGHVNDATAAPLSVVEARLRQRRWGAVQARLKHAIPAPSCAVQATHSGAFRRPTLAPSGAIRALFQAPLRRHLQRRWGAIYNADRVFSGHHSRCR